MALYLFIEMSKMSRFLVVVIFLEGVRYAKAQSAEVFSVLLHLTSYLYPI